MGCMPAPIAPELTNKHDFVPCGAWTHVGLDDREERRQKGQVRRLVHVYE